MPRYVKPEFGSDDGSGRKRRPKRHTGLDFDDMLDLSPGQKRRRRRRMRDTLSDDVWLEDECPCIECDNTHLLRVDLLTPSPPPPIDPLSVDTPSNNTPSEEGENDQPSNQAV